MIENSSWFLLRKLQVQPAARMSKPNYLPIKIQFELQRTSSKTVFPASARSISLTRIRVSFTAEQDRKYTANFLDLEEASPPNQRDSLLRLRKDARPPQDDPSAAIFASATRKKRGRRRYRKFDRARRMPPDIPTREFFQFPMRMCRCVFK